MFTSRQRPESVSRNGRCAHPAGSRARRCRVRSQAGWPREHFFPTRIENVVMEFRYARCEARYWPPGTPESGFRLSARKRILGKCLRPRAEPAREASFPHPESRISEFHHQKRRACDQKPRPATRQHPSEVQFAPQCHANGGATFGRGAATPEYSASRQATSCSILQTPLSR